MLSESERRAIEAEAAARVRAEWGHVNPRRLGDVVAEIRARIEDGSWGQQTLPERLDTMARLAYEHAVFTRDEASLGEPERVPERGLEPGD